MRFRKWTMPEQAYFLKRTGELLERGYPLAEAIDSLAYHMEKKRKEEITNCLLSLKEGYPLYKILSELGFNRTLLGFVYFAEQHGGLSSAFQNGSQMMLNRNKDLIKLKKILYYPLFLILITIFLFFFVERILLPKYSSLFQSMNLKENVFTKLVYLFGDMFPILMTLMFFIALFLCYYYFYVFRKQSPIKRRTIITSIPFIGPFFRLLTTHYVSIQLSYLLGGGLSIFDALKLFENHIKHPFDRELGKEFIDLLISGQQLETILAHYPFFERELAQIVKHGIENGKLHQELFFYSQHCLKSFEERTEKLFKIIQPLLYSIIGAVIVSMYLAILLPMFHLLDGF